MAKNKIMFAFSFSQLLLVLVIGLLVLGPQKLPIAIKTVVGWMTAMRAIFSSLQLELTKEMKLQQLQDSLCKAEKSGLQNITPEIKVAIEELKHVTASMQEIFRKEMSGGTAEDDNQATCSNAHKTDRLS